MAAGRAGKHVQVAPSLPETENVEDTAVPGPGRRSSQAGRLMCVACGTVVETPSP